MNLFLLDLGSSSAVKAIVYIFLTINAGVLIFTAFFFEKLTKIFFATPNMLWANTYFSKDIFLIQQILLLVGSVTLAVVSSYPAAPIIVTLVCISQFSMSYTLITRRFFFLKRLNTKSLICQVLHQSILLVSLSSAWQFTTISSILFVPLFFAVATKITINLHARSIERIVNHGYLLCEETLDSNNFEEEIAVFLYFDILRHSSIDFFAIASRHRNQCSLETCACKQEWLRFDERSEPQRRRLNSYSA